MLCEGVTLSFAWGTGSELETQLEVKPSMGKGTSLSTPAYGRYPPSRVGRRLGGW